MILRFDELKATNQLPSPKGAALAILRHAESGNASVHEIVRIIQTDPALSGRLLKIANSAQSGRLKPVTSVQEAVIQVGFLAVRNVALSFSLISQNAMGPCKAFDYGRFWSHSLAMAIAAQAFAKYIGGITPPEAFTFGLLAQVGRLAFASIYPEIYTEILSQVPVGDAHILRDREIQRFAMDHGQLTGAMLRDWGLPEDFVFAAEAYEVPGAAESAGERQQRLVRLLRMAALAADACLADGAARSETILTLVAGMEALDPKPEDLPVICDQIVAGWREWGSLLQVETTAVPSFADLLDQARTEQSASISPPSRPGECRLNIVVVDDDRVSLLALAGQLVKAGHQVNRATNGEEALRLVLEVAPHLVITDYRMPGMDGGALTRALRQTKLGQQLYIIVLTGSEGDEAQVDAFAAGADDYMVKPIRAKILAARLQACARVIQLQDDVRREREELQRCMTDLAGANRKLHAAASTDMLTGLFNRRYAMDRLEADWAASIRTGKPLACMMIDVDHFKCVNDTYGHDIGDRVLKAVAERLSSNMRSTDALSRLGGEEFLIIGANMDQDIAVSCAERLRSAVQELVIELSTGHLQVTISVGVSIRSPSMKKSDALLKKADEAVYLAKAGGRNRVCFEPDTGNATLCPQRQSG
jgi:diguanylate cyclase (GGDEF)-like protein